MRLPSHLAWLMRKEWRALTAAKSWWCLLVLMGPLVGVAFIAAARTYVELSVYGTTGGAGEIFSPLIGVWAPTFSACELAAAFLLPFVTIAVVASDRQSGALKLELQRPLSPAFHIAAKTLVLIGGWAIATLVPLSAVMLWRLSGGAVHGPELAAVIGGHLLNGALTIALASAAASIADHPATAAIATLAVTVGTWVISFVGAIHGGIWERASTFTPAAMIAEFQHGLIRLDLILSALVLVLTGLGLAGVWTRMGRASRRIGQSAGVVIVSLIALSATATIRGSWDVSENRLNSFSRADERALSRISEPLVITAYLAPEDPRRVDLERNVISKLRRTLRDIQVIYHSETTSGLFEQQSGRYGEIHYRLGSRESAHRATTVEGVLEAIYSLAGQAAELELDEEDDETVFRGHPLTHQPIGARLTFYGGWPAVALLAALRSRRRGS